MDVAEPRRGRLENLLNLARIRRGWSRAQLARALDRDPTKILPDSANPKLDYVIKLAEVLEWPVGEVVDAIWAGADLTQPAAEASFEQLTEQITAAVRHADFTSVVDLAQKMFRAARTPDEHAHACIREAAGWDGMGRYQKVLDAARRGLAQPGISTRLRLVLQASLANAQYTLWDLTPALGTAEVLADWYEANPPTRDVDQKRVAYVYYVRGNTRRRLMAIEPDAATAHAEHARADLTKADEMYRALADTFNDHGLRGVANTCRGGLIEIDVQTGRRPALDAVTEIRAALDASGLPSADLPGDWVESYGWWCIFGSNIALRHLKGRDLQQSLNHLTAKALEIAERLDNWAMRERVYTIQYALHALMVDATGLELALDINDQDRSLITATMGRFPAFRETGWRLLDSAKALRHQKEAAR